MLPPDIDCFIARNFAPSEREAAARLCQSATLHDGSAPGARLIRCALVASGSSLARLRSEIGRLRVDFRDVIVAGEYAVREEKLVRVRNLNEPFEDKV